MTSTVRTPEPMYPICSAARCRRETEWRVSGTPFDVKLSEFSTIVAVRREDVCDRHVADSARAIAKLEQENGRDGRVILTHTTIINREVNRAAGAFDTPNE